MNLTGVPFLNFVTMATKIKLTEEEWIANWKEYWKERFNN